MTALPEPRRPASSTRRRGTLIPRTGRDGTPAWSLKLFIGTDAAGRRRYYTERFEGTKTAARHRLHRLLTDLGQGALRAQSRETVAEYLLGTWLTTGQPREVRARTRADYAAVFARYVVPRIGTVPLARLTALHVQGVIDAMHARGLTERTMRLTRTLLRAALEQAVAWGAIAHNPLGARRAVTIPKTTALRPTRSARTRTFTADEVRAFLDATAAHEHGPLWRVAFATGCRPGELYALQWGDLGTERGRLHVRRSLQPDGTFAALKTKAGAREIVLTPETLAAFREQRARQAGITTPHSPHDCRRTCATLLLEAGVPLKVVSAQLGHASIVLTADVYSHVTAKLQENAASAMAAILG